MKRKLIPSGASTAGVKRINGIKSLYGNRLSVRDSLKAQAALELFKKEQARNA